MEHQEGSLVKPIILFVDYEPNFWKALQDAYTLSQSDLSFGVDSPNYDKYEILMSSIVCPTVKCVIKQQVPYSNLAKEKVGLDVTIRRGNFSPPYGRTQCHCLLVVRGKVEVADIGPVCIGSLYINLHPLFSMLAVITYGGRQDVLCQVKAPNISQARKQFLQLLKDGKPPIKVSKITREPGTMLANVL